MALSFVPLAGQSLLVTRDPIHNNFVTIDAAFIVDHLGYNLPDQGKHRRATFPVMVAPGAVGVNDVGIYAANSAALYGGNPELFINKTASQVPFTASLKATPSGWTCLPSGVIIQWAQGTLADHVFSVNVALPISFPTAYLTCQATTCTVPGGDIIDAVIVASPLGLNQITVTRKVHWTAITFNVLAIGY